MPDQLYIGNIPHGMRTDRLPFNIDNNAFPNLFNMYAWRGRVKKKRGTITVGQLQVQVQSFDTPTPPSTLASWQYGPITINPFANLLTFVGIDNTGGTITNIIKGTTTLITVSGTYEVGNIVYIIEVQGMTQINQKYATVIAIGTGTITVNINSSSYSNYTSAGVVTFIQSANIVPGTVSLTGGGNTYTDVTNGSITYGVLTGTPSGSGFINYTSGWIFISGFSGTVIGTFSYYPGLPAMGLQDFTVSNSTTVSGDNSSLYPTLLAFDTQYNYQINAGVFYNTSYYVSGTAGLPGNPLTSITNPAIQSWSGQDYQQFWTTNYSGSLWATNNNPGMHLLKATIVSHTGMTITFNFKLNSLNYPFLVVGDVVWCNEFPVADGINGICGVITSAAGSASGNYVVTFTFNVSVTDTDTGIIQVLTNTIPQANNFALGPPVVATPQDGIRYYTGSPTSATTGLPANNNLGWVNFAPPLNLFPLFPTNFSINSRPPGNYYLVGALAILPFKDRLLFFSPWIQTSDPTTLVQLTDSVLWSWNGTPYYACSTITGTGPSAVYSPQPFIVPLFQSAAPIAYYVNQTGLGGYQSAGLSQPIMTISNNEDALLIGFGGDGRKTRFVFTGNDLQPFLFFNINSELPSSATFSAVALDKGVIDIGQYGIAMTDQQSSQRIDLDIPDSVFTIQSLNNGVQRVNAIRDFYREWIYFSYPVFNNNSSNMSGNPTVICKFPTQTFLYNYRDNTWAIFYENWTCHGSYRRTQKKSWLTTGFKSWNTWREPWNAGSGSPQFPSIVAGNPQGYVLQIGEGTGESPSGSILAIQSTSNGLTQITSVNHCVTDQNQNTDAGDYLLINGITGLYNTPITGITLSPTPGTNTVITTSNTYSAGNLVTLSGIMGTTQLNNNTYQIITATSTTITLNVDSSSFTPYVSGGTTVSAINGIVGQVDSVVDVNNFVVDIPFPLFQLPFGNNYIQGYVGGGTYTRLIQPLMQTKQFQPYWEEGRQVRLGVQKYMMDITTNSQVTLNIYLTQNPSAVWNNPFDNSPPNSLVYSQILYTCPESTNIGLTQANQNLLMPIVQGVYQLWHRCSTSLQGESVQIGITLSDAQMRNVTYATSEVTLHGMHLTVERGPPLA